MEPIDMVAPGLEGTVEVHSYLGPGDERSLADDVLDGLTRPLKELPPKHLYDARGSRLFDAICELPEYYQTRTERLILEAHADDIVEHTGAVELVELGSGSATKTRVLLDAMDVAGTLRRYVPVDVSATTVHAIAELFTDEYPGLAVHGVVGDFERHLDNLPAPAGPRLVPFLGGTIGNFPPGSRRRFLRSLAKVLGPDGHLLLGTDLVKDPLVIEAAYDDSAGVTAQFNLNLLVRANRELGADFNLHCWHHRAIYNDREHRIEMHLISELDQVVQLGGRSFAFAAGEIIITEFSYKHTIDGFTALAVSAGFKLSHYWTDPGQMFAVFHFTVAA